MFSSDLDTARHPLSTRSWGIILGSVMMVSVAAALVSARTIPFTLAVTLAAFISAALLRGKSDLVVPQFGTVSLVLGAFLLYASVSALWAIDPGVTLSKTALAILIMFGTIVLSQLIASETRPNLFHMGEGVWIGLFVALIYFFIEIITEQSIKIWVHNALAIDPRNFRDAGHFTWSGDQVIAFARDDLARSAAPVTLFIWPAVLAVQGTLVGPPRTIGAAVIVTLAGVVIMLSPHETSKLTFLAGLGVFGCAFSWPRFTARLVAIGWVCACLAVLPAALLAHRLDLQNAAWLQKSAQERIEIWHATAEEVFRAPLFGVGARTTYVQSQQLRTPAEPDLKNPNLLSLSTHAHSVYLQTWYELGFMGVMLLMLFGLSIVNAIKRLAGAVQPYAYATFTSAAVVAAFSYGMWQTWFLAMFGFCVVLFSVGRSVSPR
jgi:hypothetical protein